MKSHPSSLHAPLASAGPPAAVVTAVGAVVARAVTARLSAQQRIENLAMPVGVHAAAPSPPPAATKKPLAHAVLVQIFLLSSAHPVPRAALAWTSWCEHRRAPTDAHSAAASV